MDERTFELGFQLARLLPDEEFRARVQAQGRLPGEVTVPAVAEMTLGYLLRLAGDRLPGAVVVALADADAPHGFRLMRLTEVGDDGLG